MIVYSQVAEAIVAAGVATPGRDDHKRRALPSAPIAAREVAGGERREQPLSELAGGQLERVRHRVDHRRSRQQVALRRETRAGAATRPGQAALARKARAASSCIDDPGLALGGVGVGPRERVERLAGGRCAGQQSEPVRSVGGVRERLRGDGADAGREIRHDGTDREELRRDRDPELLGVEVAGDDRERHPNARTSSPGAPSCTVASTPSVRSASRSAAGVPVSTGNVP